MRLQTWVKFQIIWALKNAEQWSALQKLPISDFGDKNSLKIRYYIYVLEKPFSQSENMFLFII